MLKGFKLAIQIIIIFLGGEGGLLVLYLFEYFN